MIVNVPVSIGELIDKLTILAIKHQYAKNTQSQNNIKKEADYLLEQAMALQLPDTITELGEQLYNVNLELWHIEDSKRQHERRQIFDDEFIQLARSVYIKNDLRASIKKQINIICNSDSIEEKIY